MAIHHTSPRQPFSLFALHFSLPAGTLFTSVMQCGALALAACCIGCCSVLRWASQRTAFSSPLLSESPRSTFYFSLFTLHFLQGPFFTFHFSLFTYIMRRAAFPDLLLSESPRSIFPAFIGCFPVNAGGGWPVRAMVLTWSSSSPSLFDACGCWCRRGWLGSIFQPVSPPPDTRPAG